MSNPVIPITGVEELCALTQAIEASRHPRRLPPFDASVHIVVPAFSSLRRTLIGNGGAHIVRYIYRALKFNERRLFRWRLEHKLIQALVLAHYVPTAMVATYGLGCLVRQFGNRRLCYALKDIFPRGVFIKPTLGDASGDEGIPNLAESVLQDVEQGSLRSQNYFSMVEESYVVQEHINIAHEYRVHTVEDRVVSNLTFDRYETVIRKRKFASANAFVQAVLDRLPDGMVGQSMFGWDVAETKTGDFKVIEVNLAGFHPIYNAGFHCSGFFQDQLTAGDAVTSLLRYVEKTYNLVVHCPQPANTDQEQDRIIYGEIQRRLAA